MSEAASSSSISENICSLCNEKSSKYCCPRCELFYCSIECYKCEKHLTCSESFYRDCVNEELASYENDERSKLKMMEILKKMHNDNIEQNLNTNSLGSGDHADHDDDSDDDDDIDLNDRVRDINLDDADVLWDALTQDEKNEFQAMISEGNIESVILQWVPWWSFNWEEKLVQEVGRKNSEENEALKQCPELKQVPKFKSLTKVHPSPTIKFNIINVISSYAFVSRYFNGEFEPFEGIGYFLSICDNLEKNANFGDILEAIDSVAQKCLQSELIETDANSLDVMQEDTFSIIQGPSKDNKTYYSRAALSHLHKLMSQVKNPCKSMPNSKPKERKDFSRRFPDHETEHLPKLNASKVKMCIKKVEYYLSYIESFGLELE